MNKKNVTKTFASNCSKLAKRSDFSLSKTVEAAHVTKEILHRKLDTIPLETLRPRRKYFLEAEIQEMADRELQSLKDVQEMSTINDAFEHGKSLRGKSAKSIEMQLKTEALKNLSRGHELADIRKWQREAVQVYWEESEHHKVMEERQKNLTDMEKISAPLSALKKELKGFEEKTSNYFLDKRYSISRKKDL